MAVLTGVMIINVIVTVTILVLRHRRSHLAGSSPTHNAVNHIAASLERTPAVTGSTIKFYGATSQTQAG